jgi:RHS repeat-associated protein
MKLRCFLSISALAISFGPIIASAQIPYPGNDSDHGVTRVVGLFDPYTGNTAFSTRDLVVAGAAGRYGLSWSRHATSRTSQTENLFGLAHNWAHGWQWEMVDAGKDTQGRAVLSVREPQGWVHRYTETSPGQWWPAPGVRDRVVSSGDSFTVQRHDAGEIRFTRQTTKTGNAFQVDGIADPEGNAWEFSWQSGCLVQVSEPAGRWLKITYGSLVQPKAAAGSMPFKVITSVAASDGQVVNYTYEFLPDSDYPSLTAVSYPDGTVAQYSYATSKVGSRRLLSWANDPHGDRALRGRLFTYRQENGAAQGQIAEIKTQGGAALLQSLATDGKSPRSYAVGQTNGATIYQTFAPGGNLIEEIDALGFAKTRAYDSSDRGFRTATTDSLGRVTSFQNDANGDVVKTIYADGTSTSTERDGLGRVLAETNELGHTRRIARDAQGRITVVTMPDASKETTAFNKFGQVVTRTDRAGAVTRHDYSERGLLVQTTNAIGATTTFAYDVHDRLAASTDPRGNTTRYERDLAGRVAKTIYADGTSTATAYNAYGEVTKIVDAAGSARTMVYDAFGRITSTFDALGHESRTEYAAIGKDAPLDQPLRRITPEGRITSTSYDAAGRPVARTLAAGTRDATTVRTVFDAAGRLASATDARGKTVKYFYDERGRRVRTQSAMKHATTTVFDATGRKISETDAKGNTTRWTYDALGRELTKTDALNQVTRRAYDAAGRLATLTDAKGNAYRFEFNALGRQTALVYPDGSRETAEYDPTGLKIRTTNRAGTSRAFTYDNRNREISSEWGDGSQKITKAYDSAGRMTREETAVSTISYTFDAAGRLASETQDLSAVVTGGIIDPVPRAIRYTYTADGQKESLTYPDGSFVRYTYNARGQLQDILGDGVPPPIASYDYDAAGNATKMPRENDTETLRSYDDENKVAAIAETGPRRSPLSQLDYEYDEVGNRTATIETLRSPLASDAAPTISRDSYFYDQTYQVTGADYGVRMNDPAAKSSGFPRSLERFAYDPVGNRTTSGLSTFNSSLYTTAYSTNNLNQYTLIGDFVPTHDRNGNLASLLGWSYRYDVMNRLVEANSATMTARFYYDAKNRCVARSYNGTVSLNSYDGWNLIEERTPAGVQQARYVHGRRIDEIIVMVNKYGVFYPHHDVLGNVKMLTDTNGKLVERYDYSVAGQVTITSFSGVSVERSTVGNRWMFTGREQLGEVALIDSRNRMYSSKLGRFLQTDPIRFQAGDMNIYRYVENKLVFTRDPTGLGPGDDFATVGQAIDDIATWLAANGAPGIWEYGSFVYANSGGGFSYTTPITSFNSNHIEDSAWGPTAPNDTVLLYHNHSSSGTSNLSNTDRSFSIPMGMHKFDFDETIVGYEVFDSSVYAPSSGGFFSALWSLISSLWE